MALKLERGEQMGEMGFGTIYRTSVHAAFEAYNFRRHYQRPSPVHSRPLPSLPYTVDYCMSWCLRSGTDNLIKFRRRPQVPATLYPRHGVPPRLLAIPPPVYAVARNGLTGCSCLCSPLGIEIERANWASVINAPLC